MAAVRDFLATATGGWAAVNGDFAGAADQVAVVQGIRIRCRMLRGDCWLDESIGLPYLEQILVKNPDLPTVRALIAGEIGAVPDVTAVVGVLPTLNPDRTATIDYEVSTVYSTEPLRSSVSAP